MNTHSGILHSRQRRSVSDCLSHEFAQWKSVQNLTFVPGVWNKFPYNYVEIMGGKFSHKLEVLLPWILLNRTFLKENWQSPHAGRENFGAKIFPNCFWDSAVPVWMWTAGPENQLRKKLLFCFNLTKTTGLEYTGIRSTSLKSEYLGIVDYMYT